LILAPCYILLMDYILRMKYDLWKNTLQFAPEACLISMYEYKYATCTYIVDTLYNMQFVIAAYIQSFSSDNRLFIFSHLIC